MRPDAVTQPTGRAVYEQRINAVMDHVESNLGAELRLSDLASVANFSPFHFHRLFGAIVGETLNRFIARVRLERAAALLIQEPNRSITDVGLACGFATPSAFARSFKATYDMTAGQWRSGGYENFRKGDGTGGPLARRFASHDQTTVAPLLRSGPKPEPEPVSWQLVVDGLPPASVTIEDRSDIEVAYVRHTGPFQGMAEVFADIFGELMTWAHQSGLPDPEAEQYALYHDNPGLTDDNKLRVSACLPVAKTVKPSGRVGRTTIGGGTFAVCRFRLGPSDYEAAWTGLLGAWLPQSGYEPADGPYFERFRQTDRVAESVLGAPGADPDDGRHPVDIFVPVKPMALA